MISKRKLGRVRLKGQYTMYALLMTVLTIVAYTQIYPFLKDIIDEAVTDMDSNTALLVSLSPLFIFLFILWSAVWYVSPMSRQPPQ
jgi:hypothetical protein